MREKFETDISVIIDALFSQDGPFTGEMTHPSTEKFKNQDAYHLLFEQGAS